jgi:hypothetical protein
VSRPNLQADGGDVVFHSYKCVRLGQVFAVRVAEVALTVLLPRRPTCP